MTLTESAQTINFDTALRTAADRAAAFYPAEQARIQRGLAIARSGGVTLKPTGLALVTSQAHPFILYHVNGTCPCPDARTATNGWCKHRWAKSLYKAAALNHTPPAAPGHYYATYVGPDQAPVAGVATWQPTHACWLFIPDDGREPLYPALQALSLGGHIVTADAQREADGSLAAKVCGHPESHRCPTCGYIGCRGGRHCTAGEAA